MRRIAALRLRDPFAYVDFRLEIFLRKRGDRLPPEIPMQGNGVPLRKVSEQDRQGELRRSRFAIAPRKSWAVIERFEAAIRERGFPFTQTSPVTSLPLSLSMPGSFGTFRSPLLCVFHPIT